MPATGSTIVSRTIVITGQTCADEWDKFIRIRPTLDDGDGYSGGRAQDREVCERSADTRNYRCLGFVLRRSSCSASGARVDAPT